MKIGFLFNHEAAHQAKHLIPVLRAVTEQYSDYSVFAYVCDASMRTTIEKHLPAHVQSKVSFIDLTLPKGVGLVARILDGAMPASRVARLYCGKEKFEGLDALVAPERTCLYLKRYFGLEGVKFIHVRHGVGDRAIGFHPTFKYFDLLLLQGNKYLRKLRETGGLNENNDYALIGYPKFDTVDFRAPRKKLFDNDKPVVFYNPHFAPGFSSWNKVGIEVLEYFAANKDFNLIFAPHVMLFKKRIHINPSEMRVEIRRNIPEHFFECENILIDVDSPNLLDMTYTLNSDLYLADVSSQVMEFLVRPRPCVFLNPYRLDWQDKDEFASWRLGEVVEDMADLGPALEDAFKNNAKYAAAQRAHFADSIDFTGQRSSTRAAHAIGEFLEGRKDVLAPADEFEDFRATA